MLGDLALVEDDVLLRTTSAAGQERGRHLRVGAHSVRSCRTVIACREFTTHAVIAILQRHELGDGAKIIAEMQVAGRLHAGKNASLERDCPSSLPCAGAMPRRRRVAQGPYEFRCRAASSLSVMTPIAARRSRRRGRASPVRQGSPVVRPMTHRPRQSSDWRSRPQRPSRSWRGQREAGGARPQHRSAASGGEKSRVPSSPAPTQPDTAIAAATPTYPNRGNSSAPPMMAAAGPLRWCSMGSCANETAPNTFSGREPRTNRHQRSRYAPGRRMHRVRTGRGQSALPGAKARCRQNRSNDDFISARLCRSESASRCGHARCLQCAAQSDGRDCDRSDTEAAVRSSDGVVEPRDGGGRPRKPIAVSAISFSCGMLVAIRPAVPVRRTLQSDRAQASRARCHSLPVINQTVAAGPGKLDYARHGDGKRDPKGDLIALHRFVRQQQQCEQHGRIEQDRRDGDDADPTFCTGSGGDRRERAPQQE